jgi:hypothetical protein
MQTSKSLVSHWRMGACSASCAWCAGQAKRAAAHSVQPILALCLQGWGVHVVPAHALCAMCCAPCVVHRVRACVDERDELGMARHEQGGQAHQVHAGVAAPAPHGSRRQPPLPPRRCPALPPVSSRGAVNWVLGRWHCLLALTAGNAGMAGRFEVGSATMGSAGQGDASAQVKALFGLKKTW